MAILRRVELAEGAAIADAARCGIEVVGVDGIERIREIHRLVVRAPGEGVGDAEPCSNAWTEPSGSMR